MPMSKLNPAGSYPVSFSVNPQNTEDELAVNKLKEHSQKTGISFSYLILKGVKTTVEELKL